LVASSIDRMILKFKRRWNYKFVFIFNLWWSLNVPKTSRSLSQFRIRQIFDWLV
jgi:hypothetical protein